MNDRRLPSASAARLSGDDFQHVITWIEALRLLEGGGVTSIGFEVGQAEAGVVDDLVIRRDDEYPDRYAQIKFAVDETTPLTHEWFTDPPKKDRPTPLQRFFSAYRELGKDGHPAELELITNRRVAPGDPILELRENISGTLVPRLFASGNVASVEARAGWAARLGIDEGELERFLARLVISPSRGTLDELLARSRGAMALVGLRGDKDATVLATAALRRKIEEGCREFDPDALRALIEEVGLLSAPAYATLLIEEIKPSPLAALAPAHVNWVDLFEGDTPDERRRTRDPDAWEAVMRPDLRRAIGVLEELGSQMTVRIEGAYRLPSAFVVGFELSERSGVELVLPFAGGEWSTAATPQEASLRSEIVELGGGDRLAVAASISADLGDAVESYIAAEKLPVGALVRICPEAGATRHSVAGPGEARSMAEQIVDLTRAAVADSTEILLFLAAPSPLAVMLGRVWNRVPSTRVFADLSPGYAPAYLTKL